MLEVLDDVPDPIDRLNLLDEIRREMGDALTSGYERACWDARFAEREEEALAVSGMSKTAFEEYSRRWNGRFKGSARVRWTDPLGRHRIHKVLDLTKVTKGEVPESIRSGFRERHPHPPQDGYGDRTG